MRSNIYARLLKLYPVAYRERFEEEMLQVFDDMYAARRSALRFWPKVLWDTLSTAFRENLNVDDSSMLLMKRFPLWIYVAGVIVVLAIGNWTAWRLGGAAKFGNVEHGSLGFLLGMLAMYIAMRVYRWKGDRSEKRNPPHGS